MLEHQKIGDKITLKVVTDPTRFLSTVPERAKRYVTRSELKKNGFTRRQNALSGNKEIWTRDYSGVVKLDFYFRDKSIQYKWSVNRKNLNDATQELKQIHDVIKDSARILMKARKEKMSPSPDQLYPVWQKIASMRKQFYLKYIDFLKLYNDDVRIQTPHLRSESFFFEAFMTSADLHAAFKFIELLKRVRGTLIDSPKRERLIDPESVKQALLSYHMTLRMVRYVREAYSKGMSIKKISETSNLPPGLVEDMTEDIGGNSKGWKMKASEFALFYAVGQCSTTESNFKQMLKYENEASAVVRDKVEKLSIENFVHGRIPVEDFHSISLKREIIPMWEWERLFEWSMAAFAGDDKGDAE